MAGAIAPIAGLGGEQTAVPMAVIVLVLVAVSFAALRLAAGAASPHPVHAR
jgi:DHA1 family bicyclomycin/chloramphenicol resistance-like MFS transporter